jgi:hypothetical protein
MNKDTKTVLLFLGGVVWAAVSSRKAYAPSLQPNDMMSNLDPNRNCEPGQVKQPIAGTIGGFTCVDEETQPVVSPGPQPFSSDGLTKLFSEHLASGNAEFSYNNASGRRTNKRQSFRSEIQQVRDLQQKYPYNSKNKKKPWWKCGCAHGGVGGCVRGACIGPGTITIRF